MYNTDNVLQYLSVYSMCVYMLSFAFLVYSMIYNKAKDILLVCDAGNEQEVELWVSLPPLIPLPSKRFVVRICIKLSLCI